jgi:hypothetical protein
MQITIEKFERLLVENAIHFRTISASSLEEKISEDKWSRKEIIGHLIDSSIHNLVRFTEINYVQRPYVYRTYNQNDLIKINAYQTMDVEELVQLWYSINIQIIRIFKSVTKEALAYEIQLSDMTIVSLKFLMNDYVEHMEHHINQIKN